MGSANRKPHSLAMIGLVPILAILAIFFLGPLWVNVVQSLNAPPGVGRGYEYARFLGDPYYRGVLYRTLLLALAVSFLCLLLGYPLAYVVARSTGRWRAVLMLVVVAPLMVNVVVRSFGWMIILGGAGAINSALVWVGLPKLELMYNWTGVTIALVQVLLPFMVLSIASVLETIDLRLEEAAASLGAAPVEVFIHVILPLTLNGVLTGAIVVFTLTMGSFVTVLLLGNNSTTVLPLAIYEQLTSGSDWPFAAAISVVLLVIVSVVLLLQSRLSRQRIAR